MSWETAHVLFAEADRATGVVTCQIGDVKSGEVYDPAAIMFAGGFGMITMPAPPIAGVAAAEVTTLNTPAGNIIVGARSVRSAKIGALIKMGESAIYADGSQALALFKLDGSVNLLTRHDNTDAGRNVQFSVAPDGMRFEWPWSRFKLEKDGLHYDHTGGSLFDLSKVTLSGPFAPLEQFSNILTMRFDVGKIEASFISIGAHGAIKSPVARADASLSVLQAIQAEIAALADAVVKIAATPAVVSSPPSANPAVAASLVSLSTAVSAATGAMELAVGATVPVPGPIGARSLATA